MAASAYFLFTVNNLAPGATFNFTWKNIPPATAYRLDASPYLVGSYDTGYTSTSQVEVTRFWRRKRSIEHVGDPQVEIHQDVLGTIKNVGNETTSFDAYLIAVT